MIKSSVNVAGRNDRHTQNRHTRKDDARRIRPSRKSVTPRLASCRIGTYIVNANRTGEGQVMAAKFEVYEQSNGGYGFRLKAANGQIIAQGQNYKTKDAAMAGIEAVKSASASAHVEQGLSMRHG
jgi:uncharacterized protein